MLSRGNYTAWALKICEDEQMTTFVIDDMLMNDGEYGKENQDAENETQPGSPVSPFTTQDLRAENYDDNVTPKRSRLISDIYNDTEEVTLDEELYLMGIEEPANYKEAVKDQNWHRAMEAEIDSIEKNGTRTLVKLPLGHKEIGLKWIFKLKRDATGKVTKHKARLVAKEYAQEHGIDYEEVYAPVTRLETIRLLLALSAKRNWQVHHLDVKTAFLNGEINEDVYVSQPEGYKKQGHEDLVYKLTKALYRLRQARRAWYAKLNRCLEVTGANVTKIEEFKLEMGVKFEMTDLGRFSYYLGIEVE
ncbi:hypothetical protein AgCh_014720 [Apium graveolens]